MKKKWINKNLVLGIVFFLLFIGIVVASELDVFGDFDSVEVMLAKKDISVDHEITEKDIYFTKMPVEYLTEEMIRDSREVIGMKPTVEVKANSFFTKDVLERGYLRPTKKHSTYPIPTEWILELQGSLRRYDIVNVVAVPNLEPLTEENNNTTLFIPSIREPVLENVPVMYVKNRDNTEVEGEKGLDDRLNGKTTPSQIELSLTLEEFKKMEDYYLKGYQFIFVK